MFDSMVAVVEPTDSGLCGQVYFGTGGEPVPS